MNQYAYNGPVMEIDLRTVLNYVIDLDTRTDMTALL